VSRDARSFTAEHGGARRRLGHALKGSLPLLLIGLGRLVSTTASGYEVPIDEYGAHWNFFFTIAAVRSLAALVPRPSNALQATAACVLAAALHEAWLRTGGGAAWLDSSVRGADLVSQNREGIVSMVSTCAIPLRWLGRVTDHNFRPARIPDHPSGRRCIRQMDIFHAHQGERSHPGALQLRSRSRIEECADARNQSTGQAASASLVAWLAWLVITHVAGPASRRAADAAYGAWVTAHCSSLVASHAAVDSTFASVDTARQQPALIGAIGAKHVMLVTFLAANIMTVRSVGDR
jgi:GWT1